MKKILLLVALMLPMLAYAETEISTSTRTIQVDFDEVDTSAYAVGDVIDEKFTISNAAKEFNYGGIIQNVTVYDADAEGADLKLVIFEADPGTVGADNAAFDPTDSALDEIACVIDLSIHHIWSDNGVTVAENVGCAFDLREQASKDLYGVLVSNGTPTYTTATDLKVAITILQD